MMITTVLFLAGALVAVAAMLAGHRLFGFPGQRADDYSGTEPVFDPARHLAGRMIAHGVIFGPTGRVASRFTAGMEGDWQGEAGRLRERFRFAGGGTQAREWRLRLAPGGRITATADDIIGTATGRASGAGLRLCYRLRLAPDAGGHVLSATDWMYLMEDGTIVNRSEMRKFGLPVAMLVATIRPVRDV